MAYDGIIEAAGCVGGCTNCIGAPVICEDCGEAYGCDGECACDHYAEAAYAADLERLSKACGATIT